MRKEIDYYKNLKRDLFFIGLSLIVTLFIVRLGVLD